MFKKEEPKKTSEQQRPVDLRQPETATKSKTEKSAVDIKAYFDEGVRLEGKLIFEGTARIDGQVAGEILSKDTLIIGDKAKIEAQVDVNTLIVSGQVHGNIKVKTLLHLKKSGKIYGDINAPSLIIEEGGLFEGKCQMGAAAPQAASASTPAKDSFKM